MGKNMALAIYYSKPNKYSFNAVVGALETLYIDIRGNSQRLMGKSVHAVLEENQNTGERGSVFTTENASLLKDR